MRADFTVSSTWFTELVKLWTASSMRSSLLSTLSDTDVVVMLSVPGPSLLKVDKSAAGCQAPGPRPTASRSDPAWGLDFLASIRNSQAMAYKCCTLEAPWST